MCSKLSFERVTCNKWFYYFLKIQFEEMMFEDTGEWPLPLEDEESPAENSFYYFGENVHSVGWFNKGSL